MKWLHKARSAYALKISLAETSPPVWRRFAVPIDIPLDRLHDIIQIVMGWEDKHIHRFEIGERRFCDGPEYEGEGNEEGGMPLHLTLEGGTNRFTYEYDYGDRWFHEVCIEDQFEIPPKHLLSLKCTGGSFACPPEDIGGIGGYATIVEALADPQHPEYGWAKERCGIDYDPVAFDIDAVNVELCKYVLWSRDREPKAAELS